MSYSVSEIPPSTVSTWPLTYDAASEARNTAAPPISRGSAQRPSGRAAADPLVEFLVGDERRVQLGGDVAGRDRVDGDALRSQLRRERSGKGVDGALGRDVAVDGRPRQDGADRADIDDAAEAGGDHHAGGLARQAKAGGEIGGHDALDVGVGPLRQRHPVLDARVVHEDVEPAELVGGVGDRLHDGRGFGDVEGGHLGLAALGAYFLGLAHQHRAIAAVQQDAGAVVGQRLGNGEADAAGGAGHQRNASIKRECVCHFRLSTSSMRTQRRAASERMTASITRWISQASRKSGQALPLPATANSRSRTSMTFMSLKPS